MIFQQLFTDKTLKSKARTELLSQWLSQHPDQLDTLLDFAQNAKDPDKATCIEAVEVATKTNPALASPRCLAFMTQALTEKAPRVKWESARVIGNVARLYPENLDAAVPHLLANAEHPGTVVRWSAAFALGEILKSKPANHPELASVIEHLAGVEEQNSIKKIYLAALKKAKK